MTHLVIGLGEVGRAIKEVLSEKYVVSGIDKVDVTMGKFDFLHVCFPYSKNFKIAVKGYMKDYLQEGGSVVIHSTVPLGTSRKLGAVHSPVRGVHPNLKEGILTFTKYFGGEGADIAAAVFVGVGCTVKVYEKQEITEAIKLWDTTYYGWNIVFNKELKAWCDEKGLDFEEVYIHANTDYNVGYTKLGRPDVVRPVLKYMEGKIGGHCVIPNCGHLGTKIGKFILTRNKKYGA